VGPCQKARPLFLWPPPLTGTTATRQSPPYGCVRAARTTMKVPKKHRLLSGYVASDAVFRVRLYISRKSLSYEELHSKRAWEKTSKIEDKRQEETQPISRKASVLARRRLHLLPRKNAAILVKQYARPGRVIDLGCAGGDQLEGLDERFVPFGIKIFAQLTQKGNAAFEKRGGHVVNARNLVGRR